MQEQFFRPRANVVASSRGFSIEVLGRAGLLYREGERAMNVDSEFLALPHGLQLFTRSIERWEPPYDREELGSDARNEIVDNIRRAFADDGIEVEVA